MTAQTYAVPLLFIPPWINKFYVLDLQPKNSLVRFLLEQGFSVFMISWKNPDASMEAITFEDYMTDGPLAASDVVREITGTERINPVGYCIGGTLLAMTLAYLAAQRDERFGAATFMVSLLDFSEVGDTAVFIDEPQIAYMEQQMLERGYLDSRRMSDMFNLLRANDLIWNTVINNYLMGNKPPAFDLLYWNNDGTRMARAAHSFYLRNTYLENNLIKPGKISLLGQPIDLRRIRPRHLRGGRREGPHRALALGLADRAADKRAGPLRSGCERAYRRHDQSTVQGQRRVLDERHRLSAGDRRRLAGRRAKA